MKKSGLKPVIAVGSKVLVLGSMPGKESLFRHEYYGNVRNAFWEIMGRLFGFDWNAEYTVKLKCLVDHKIALWDVIGECQRKGSLDSSIITDTILVNDFGSLLSKYPSIEYVFFNGKTAEKEYRKRVLPNLGILSREIKYDVLPSTSPAHATLDKEQKLAKWSMVKYVLNKP